MKQLLEYLLSNNKKTIHENYYVLWPHDNDLYNTLNKIYKDKKIESSVDYWILSEFEISEIAKDFDRRTLINELDIYSIPDNYDINDVREGILKRRFSPPIKFNRIHIDELL